MPFPFADKPDTACFVCSHVLEGRPVLYVSHDDDGYWQFLCGGEHSEQDARIVSLLSAYELDKGLGALAPLTMAALHKGQM